MRRGSLQTWTPRRGPAESRIEGHSVYGGIILDHYGHFLVDTLARYWCVRGHDTPVVWHKRHRRVLDWQHEIFDMLSLARPRS